MHPEIIGDIENFLQKMKMPRMDSNREGQDAGNLSYSVKCGDNIHTYHTGELAPPAGFFATNYSRYLSL